MRTGKEKRPSSPLQPIIVQIPFEKWGVDVIGAINPPYSQQHKYILTATNDFTTWVEVIPLS